MDANIAENIDECAPQVTKIASTHLQKYTLKGERKHGGNFNFETIMLKWIENIISQIEQGLGKWCKRKQKANAMRKKLSIM